MVDDGLLVKVQALQPQNPGWSFDRCWSTGQDKFAILFDLFIGERSKSIQEYSRDSFIGLRGFGKCTLEFGLGHFVAVGYARNR
jgi:hypothetical protein